MLSVHDHPIVQHIDNEISQREARLSELQIQKVTLTKALLKSTYEVAQIICYVTAQRSHLAKFIPSC
ncbi:hypothetical protein JI57_02070 [Psychromonas sp. PRT-SC03]|nr:hypothetical protein JI57_02070 [Psychromonas sp. PRT-SC03]